MDSWPWAPVPGKYPCHVFLLLLWLQRQRCELVVAWRTHFMATTEGSLRSASLNGFKIADPLVINAKYDPTLMERREKQSFSTFLPCVCY